MDADARKAIVEELAAAFGGAEDVTPEAGQPLHVLLPQLRLPPPWRPSPTSALMRFAGWPDARPDFLIAPGVVNGSGDTLRSSSEQYVLGRAWRQFSFNFPWPSGPATATRAVQLWLTRFREVT